MDDSTIRSIPAQRERTPQVTDAGLDQPIPDVVEQSQDAIPGDSEDRQVAPPSPLPIEADAADVAEQARELGPDDDEYR
jgi:hypothetical protein